MCGDGAGTSYQLLWKPLHVPSGQALNIFYDQLKAAEVHCSDSVETNIEEDEGPFEKGVDGVGYVKIRMRSRSRACEPLTYHQRYDALYAE